VRVVAFATEQRHHIAALPAGLFGRVHEGADAGEALEVFLDIRARLLARDTELVGKAECRNTVDDAEIDSLGAAAHLATHTLHRPAELFPRRHRVNVGLLAGRALERLNVGDLCEEPQLDLRVVSRYDLGAGRCNERAPDLATILGSYRDVLQIRIE